MNALPVIEPAARLIVAALFNSLWESALLALAVWLILRALPNLNATTRYVAWCVALCASVLLPVATAIPQIRVEAPARTAAQATVVVSHAGPVSHASLAKEPARISSAPSYTTAPSSVLRAPARLRFSLPNVVAISVFAVWIVAAALLLVRLAFNLYKLERLKSDALPLPIDYRERLSHWTAAEKGERDVRLCTCETIEVPVAVGLFDSMILIPQHLLETLAPDEIDQIMLHELGHLRRADDWTNGVQRVIQALFFFNPAVMYIAAQLDLEREVACDDWVLYQTKNVRPYATCLTKMAEVTAWPHRPLAAPGVFVTRRGLSVRVERLLRAGRNIRTSLSLGPAGAVVAALIVMFFLLQSVAPTFAFTLQVPQALASPAPLPSIAALPKMAKFPALPHPRTIVARNAAGATPNPRETTMIIPAMHVHMPARTIKVPAINVDTKEQRIKMTLPASPDVHFTMPAIPIVPGFGKQIADQVQQSVKESLKFVPGSYRDGDTGGMNCVGCDFSKRNLPGHSFRNQKLSGTDFSHSNLEGADFSNAILLGVDFSHADLRNVSFAHAMMTGCDLSNADLTGVNFDGASMTGCDVNARPLAPYQARSLLYACHAGCDFSGANLHNQDLRGIRLSGVDLSGADLRGTDFSNAVITGVDFSGARLDGARLNGALLNGCNLQDVDLSRVDLSGAKLTGDQLTHDHNT